MKNNKICIEEKVALIKKESMLQQSTEQLKHAFENLSNDLTITIKEIVPETSLNGLSKAMATEKFFSYDCLMS